MPTAVTIRDDDNAARLILFATAFDNNVVRDEQLWRFSNVKDVANRYETSLYLRRLIPKDADLHTIGCNLAANQNVAKNNPPPGDKNRRYYCGFSEAVVAKLRLQEANYSTELELVEENGQKAHVAFFLQTSNGSKKQRADWRTEALAKLAAALTPIRLHCCECDANDGEHPTKKLGAKCYGKLQPARAA